MIIDAHMHVCPRVGGTDDRLPYQARAYGQAEGAKGLVQLLPPSFERTDSPPELALAHMDWIGVDRAFLVQGPMYGYHNKYVAGAVNRYPDRFLGFAIVDPTQGQPAAEELAECRERGLRGLKIEWPGLRGMAPSARLGGEQEWIVWRKAQELGMILYLHTLPGKEQVEDVRRIVGDLGLTVVIAHLGNAPHEGWEEQVGLAQEGRVYLSCSALPFATKEDFPAPKARDLLKHAVETVGAEKIMWGSDYPGTLTRFTYPQTLEWVRSYCTFLEPEQMAAILGGTAEKVSEGLWR
ncbi:MAG: amidohydrolase [Armatimonadetes bacterium]|nr:amidohydrolase [Armatimonadota bacterium]